MAQLLVRQIDEDLKQRLKDQAKRRGVSMEEEARTILRNALPKAGRRPKKGLGTQIAELFKGVDWGSEELERLPRTPLEPVDFNR
ncbi:MAG TPA: plasmid stabilization protein [Rhizobiaceae bacterium]|nr:plasmid stabilization protein [Rhizobiaceae bacterium]